MRKFMKTAGTILFMLVLLIGIPGYYFIKNFDLNKYKSYAEELVQKELGRKLTINGDASIGISLVPTVIIEDVELANAEWASQPQMVKVQSLEVKFALMPLFKKQVVIDKVLLNKPQVYLEVAKDGRQNWDFNASGKTAKPAVQISTANLPAAQIPASASQAANNKAAPAAMALAGFAAKNVVVNDGLVQFNDLKSNNVINLQIKQIAMSAESMDSDLTASFDVAYNGQQINGKTTLGSLNKLLTGKEDYPVQLTAQAFGIDLDVLGNVADMMNNPAFAANVNVYNPGGNMGAPETTLKAVVQGNTQKIKADIQTLNIVNNLITGKVEADISGKVPSINATLNSDLINLGNFKQNSNFAFEFPSLINEAQASNLVPDTAIPYKDMYAVNARLALNVKQLVIEPGMVASNVIANASLQNGMLTVSPLKLSFGGGEIDGTLSVNAGQQSMALKMSSQNMLLQNLHKEFQYTNQGSFGVISGGQTDLNVNVTGKGATVRQLVNSLNGQVIAIVDKSKINTGSLSFMEGNFITQILNALQITKSSDPTLNLQCAVVRADLKNGKAEFPKGIAINAKQLTLVGDGTINLANDKIDMGIRPFSGKVVDTNVVQALSSFVKVKGTLEAPKIAIDDKQALKTVVGMVATGPAYLGSQLVLDADSSPCYTALIGTPYENRFPKPSGVQATGQEVYQDTSKVVDQGIKDLKKTGQDIIDIFRNKKK